MADAQTMAADLLDRVAGFFDAHNVTLPAVRYLAPGNSSTVAFDDDADGQPRECVMVTVDWVQPGTPGGQTVLTPGWAMPLAQAEFAILILRRAAVMDDQGVAPSPTRIEADAATNHTDLQTLHRALLAIRDSSLTADGWAPRGSTPVVGRVQTVGPQGAVMACVGLIVAEVTP
jgi:hypothetical protein